MPGPLKWGFFGAGHITFDFVNSISTLPKSDHELVAIAARDLQRSLEFAKQNKLRKAYGSYEDLASDPEIDIIYIGTIQSEHFTQIKVAISRGKHVLCEKPLCLNAKQVKVVVQLARKAKVFLMEGFWTRFLPSIIYFEKYIQDGNIGELKHIVSGHGGPNTKDRVILPELGGGSLMNFGVYGIQYATRMFGKPDKIEASGHLSHSGVDASAVVNLLYNDGQKIATIISTAISKSPNFCAYGTTGEISLMDRSFAPVKVYTPDGMKEFKMPDAPDGVKMNNPHSTGFIYEAEAVRHCIQNGKLECEKMSLDESILIAEITDEIRKQIGVKFPQD